MRKYVKAGLCFLLVLSLLCACATVFYAETVFVSGDFSYTLLDEDYVSIYSWDGTETLTIPATLDNYRVREIRNGCFNGRSDFSVVNFVWADNLYRIGYNAFKSTSISGTLNIPAQVNVVGASAFQNCDGIDTLYYNAMSNVISTQCFYDCDALAEVYIADTVNTIEDHAFSSCDSLRLVRIPETVTSISSTAFNNCPNLVIYCYTGSYAHQYAEDKGIEYVLIDAPAPTEPATEPLTEPATEPASEPATQAETVAPTEAQEYVLLGDADSDDEISVIDATLIQRLLADIQTPPLNLKAADVDGEGLDVIDATYIMRYNALILTPYPIGEWVWR